MSGSRIRKGLEMWMWVAVLVVLTVVLAPMWTNHRGSSRGAGSSRDLPSVEGRSPGSRSRMRTDWVVIAALLGAVLGMPQTVAAAGSYGAVVEKGMRGCTTDPDSGTVICFESPGVSSRSRDRFLQAWRAAHHSPTLWGAGPATLYVLASCVSVERPPAAGPVPTSWPSADPVVRCAAPPPANRSSRPARLVAGP